MPSHQSIPAEVPTLPEGRVGTTLNQIILMQNVSGSGSLDTDKVLKAVLCYKNTPDESGLSPAMILMGRQLRDSLPAIPRGGNMFENENMAKPWREMWAAKEIALADRLGKNLESLNEKVKILPKLEVGQKVRVQDLNKAKKKWHKSGTIVQVGDHHQYLVRMDGSRRVVLSNRKFLRAYQRFRDDGGPMMKKTEPQEFVPVPKPILKKKRVSEPGVQKKKVNLSIPKIRQDKQSSQLPGKKIKSKKNKFKGFKGHFFTFKGHFQRTHL